MIENWQAIDNSQKKLKMAQFKVLALLAGLLNVSLYIIAWFANIDNTKSTILFIVALGMSLYRFYRWVINSKQNKKLKDIEISMNKLEFENELLKIEEKRIELAERKLKQKHK